VCPGFALGFVNLGCLERAALGFGQPMQGKVRAGSIEIGVGIIGWIQSNGTLGEAERLLPSLLDRTKIGEAEIGGKIVGVSS